MPPTSNPSSTSESCKHPADEHSAPPNAKKARLDVADGEDATQLSSDESNNVKKHLGKLYHQDGNVIFISEKVAFRVHRTFLAGHSEVFKNMFELATYSKEGECFDGCPAIHLD
ncbi:MAG TPA: BTB/POZ domain-containing protein, partial [Chlamydiales bacterium]|nr:BTB/POZ domain-containing protein [Chlamydiales bacterium]